MGLGSLFPATTEQIEAFEVSDFDQTIFVKAFDSNVIEQYKFNNDMVTPDVQLAGTTQLPSYAFVSGQSCGCGSDALNDSIDYTP